MSVGRVVGRLAPSPTGALHLGNARSFLIAWLSARSQGGEILMRIEDIDSPRVKPWALEATLADLSWLGLDWDNAGTHWVQTNRLDRYLQVLDELKQTERIYACTCSRSEVAESASAPHESVALQLEGVIYSGNCRGRVDDAQLRAEGRVFAYRWHLCESEMSWEDQVLGSQHANPCEQLGDFVIAKSNGTPAYQLAVVVDDHDQGVTEVVRGNDLVPSTYRQLSIRKVLGWDSPSYAHVPLIIGPDGKRLAKRHGDTRLSWFRDQGIRPQAMIGYLAWSVGMIDRCQPISAHDLLAQFRWSAISTAPTVFDLARDLKLMQ